MNREDYLTCRRRARKAAALARKRSKNDVARKVKHGRRARVSS
jgi:hypothetical protein